MSVKKIDFKKEFKELYCASTKNIAVVNVPKINFLSVEGTGDPNTSQAFQDAIEALYGISFSIKMMPKSGVTPEGYFEYVVPPLEGLWWTNSEVSKVFENKDDWGWRLMIMRPKFVNQNLFEKASAILSKKKNLPALPKVKFESFEEGVSVQTLHVGPYSTERETLAKMCDFITGNNFTRNGLHHEIYLSDPRRTAPEKLKTILRQPVKKIS